jgi:hypothetical protein
MDVQQHKINSCKDCPIGTYQRYSGQSSCHTCPAQSTTIEPASREYFISTDRGKQSGCFCNVGYTGGWYWNENNGNLMFYYENGFEFPRVPEYDSYDDISNPGGLGCVACAAGKFKTILGTAACISCEAGQFSNAAAQSCIDCPRGKFSTTSSICQVHNSRIRRLMMRCTIHAFAA